MGKLNFSRTIKDSKTGILHHLPTAEYHSKGDLSVDVVTILAEDAAKTTGKKYSIVVTQSVGIRK